MHNSNLGSLCVRGAILSISLLSACSDHQLSPAPEIVPEDLYSDVPTLPPPVLSVSSSQVRGCISDIIDSLDPDISCPPPLVSSLNERLFPAQANYNRCSQLIPEIRTAMIQEMLALFAPYISDEEDLEEEMPITIVVSNENNPDFNRVGLVVIPGFRDHPDFRASPLDYLDENGIGFSKLQAVFNEDNSVITDFTVQPNGSVEPVEFVTDFSDSEGRLSHYFYNAGSAAEVNFLKIASAVDEAIYFQGEIAFCVKDSVLLMQPTPGQGVYQIAVD